MPYYFILHCRRLVIKFQLPSPHHPFLVFRVLHWGIIYKTCSFSLSEVNNKVRYKIVQSTRRWFLECIWILYLFIISVHDTVSIIYRSVLVQPSLISLSPWRVLKTSCLVVSSTLRNRQANCQFLFNDYLHLIYRNG